MRVLLTGAAGFLGCHVARALLARGDEVLALVRPTTDLGRLADVRERLTLVRADLNETESVQSLLAETRPEGCVHLAWYTAPGCYRHALPENSACLSHTIHLVRGLIAAGCRRLVAAGSGIELDTDAGCLTVSTPARPQTAYAAAKHAAHLAADRMCRESSMRLAWLRVFSVFGPWEDERRLVPQVIRALLRGERVALTEGSQERDYLHATDVARAFDQVLHSEVDGPFHVGSGRPVRIRQVVERLGDCLGRRELLAFGARPCPSGEPPQVHADPSRLLATGWRPTLNLEQGLRHTVAWWQTRR